MNTKSRQTSKRKRGSGVPGTRKRIMDVAEAHLVKKGYMGVSLEDISKEVGVSKPALYYHFPGGKEELFVKITHQAMRRTREGLERAMSSEEDGAGRLRAAARWFMAERGRGRPMDELRDVSKFVGEEHQVGLAEGFYTSLYGTLHRNIATAIDSGEFREGDPDFLTWIFLSLVSGMMGSTEVPAGADVPPPPGIPDGDEMAEQTVELFLNGARK